MPVRGLTLVVATADVARHQTALGIASANAAVGGRTRVFYDNAAVALLTASAEELFDTALDLGVEVIVCQTGLASAEVSMAALDPRIAAGGMTSLLASLGEDRLVLV